jgi:hypothetical protein
MIVKFIIHIGSFIIYWSVTAMVLTAVSPILFLALMLQPFAETGILKLFPQVLKSWTDMARDINDPVGAKERKDLAEAERLAALPPAKPKDFYDSLDYMSRKTYMDIGRGVSYHPDNDPERSDIVTPFRPSFDMVADAELLEKLKHKWLCKAQELMLVDTFTKSKWDADGYTRINDIFFAPYSVHGNPELQVTSEKEHQWLKECWSIAYDKLEYIKILMNRAYEKNNSLNKNPEFIFRYKIVSSQLASLNNRFNASVDKVRSMASALIGKRIEACDPVKFFFDFREATLKNNMYDFFKNAKKGK